MEGQPGRDQADQAQTFFSWVWNAIDAEQGITDNDWEVVQVKKAMIESAQHVICLTIAEKINSSQPFHVCPADRIDTLITELPPDDPLLEPFRRKGIRVL